MATPIVSANSSSTSPAGLSSRPPIAAGPGLPREPPSTYSSRWSSLWLCLGEAVRGLAGLGRHGQAAPHAAGLLEKAHLDVPGSQLVGELPTPALHREALDDLVRHVDQGEAQTLGALGVVVLDVAGHERADPGGRGPIDQRGARARHHRHALDQLLGLAGVTDRRQAEQRRDVGGEGRELPGRRQKPDAAEAQRAHLVLDRVDVEGRLLVGVGRDERVDHPLAQRAREHALETELARGLLDADLADGRVRAVAGTERPLTRDAEGNVDVLTDRAGAGREDGGAHGLDVALGHEADELEPVHAGRRERHDALEVESRADDLGQATVGLVDVGVGGDHRHARARRAQHELAGPDIGRDGDKWVAHERVMDEQELAVAPRGVVDRGDRGVEGHEDPMHLALAVADLQPHAVPRLGELEGSKAVDGGEDVREFHGRSLPPGERAQAVAPE